MDDLHQKLDRMSDTLTQILVVQGRHEENLREHMRRSDAAEKAIGDVRGELKPVKAHVERMDGALKFLGILSLVLGIVGGVYKFLVT